MPGRSCTSQLVGVLDKIGKFLDRGEQVDVINLDMTKAFDRVNHEILINNFVALDSITSYSTGSNHTSTIAASKSPSLDQHPPLY